MKHILYVLAHDKQYKPCNLKSIWSGAQNIPGLSYNDTVSQFLVLYR